MTSRQVREHFAKCPKRGKSGVVEAPEPVERKDSGKPRGIAAGTGAAIMAHAQHGVVAQKPPRLPRSLDPNALDRAREAAEEEARELATERLAKDEVDRMVGLRDLLQETEARVGIGDRTAADFWRPVAKENQPSPLGASESRRWWSEQWHRLEQLGMSDEGGAAEQLAELLEGIKVPVGFTRWARERKIDWLVENVKVGEG